MEIALDGSTPRATPFGRTGRRRARRSPSRAWRARRRNRRVP